MAAIDNTSLDRMQNDIHCQIEFVMRMRDGVAAGDGSQNLATALATIKVAQGIADDLVTAFDAIRVEIMQAFPEEAAARMGRAPAVQRLPVSRQHEIGFAGFVSPAGA